MTAISLPIPLMSAPPDPNNHFYAHHHRDQTQQQPRSHQFRHPEVDFLYHSLTPLESPMEEPDAYPLPVITPPEVNFSAFQFPSSRSSGVSLEHQRARSRSVNVNHQPVQPVLTRRRSHHHLSNPPPPLSSRLQHRTVSSSSSSNPNSGITYQSSQRHMSEFDLAYHSYAYGGPTTQSTNSQAQGQLTRHVSPSTYLMDTTIYQQHERRNSTSASTSSSYSISPPLSVTQSAFQHMPPHSFSSSPLSVPHSARTVSSSGGSGRASSPHTPFSAFTTINNSVAVSSASLSTLVSAHEDASGTGGGDDDDRPWDLVPYHVPWGNSYVGYKAGTLPGPEGKSVFLRSPTPTKNQRTTQACEKCRERKAKCSGTRPSCARCIARGHVCEYGPEIKKKSSFTNTPTPEPSDAGGGEDERPPSSTAGGLGIGDREDNPRSPALAVKSESNIDDNLNMNTNQHHSITNVAAVSHRPSPPVGGIGGSSNGPRPTRKLPERLKRARASVPNLRARASSHLAASRISGRVDNLTASHYDSWPRTQQPIIPPELPSLSIAQRPKLRAPIPLPLSVRIPSMQHLSLSSQNSTPISGGRGSGSPSVASELEVEANNLDQEMTTPAPTTALFFHDVEALHLQSATEAYPYPGPPSASASASSIMASPHESYASLDSYPHSLLDSHSPDSGHLDVIRDNHFIPALEGHAHGLRYSSSMPQLSLSYSMDVQPSDMSMDMPMGMNILGIDRSNIIYEDPQTYSIQSGVSPIPTDSTSSIGDLTLNTDFGHMHPLSTEHPDFYRSEMAMDNSIPASPHQAEECEGMYTAHGSTTHDPSSTMGMSWASADDTMVIHTSNYNNDQSRSPSISRSISQSISSPSERNIASSGASPTDMEEVEGHANLSS